MPSDIWSYDHYIFYTIFWICQQYFVQDCRCLAGFWIYLLTYLELCTNYVTKLTSSRSSCTEMYFKKGVHWKFRKIHRKTPVSVSFFNIVAGPHLFFQNIFSGCFCSSNFPHPCQPLHIVFKKIFHYFKISSRLNLAYLCECFSYPAGYPWLFFLTFEFLKFWLRYQVFSGKFLSYHSFHSILKIPENNLERFLKKLVKILVLTALASSK